ncbi:O-acetylhomoserine aminocarboxypropyltransferase/cysteine synthase family protein [Clostridium sp. Marseille-Q2269]|uniref:O-acetylhomoserine aminocarboxypropyltransferase/cysteine synthase family protein n=1 Tax=Clostridium sp. Marseille-Q2269 TaxID=2942205 RepID=UPI002072DE9A|nr:O-acetylhomoserine aminocarboxypropyltransferase/cysteine synthase family protein [Clostridium sp. Marseille-Q2269]
MSIKDWKTETICIQGGYTPKSGEPRILPIIQSTTYKYEDPDTVANLFDLKEEGHIYTRISNPTLAAFEEKIAQLEGGVGAVAVSSGQSAITLAVLNLCNAGDHVLASSNLYGGTFNLLSSTLTKLGIETTFVSPDLSEEEILKFAKENTKVVLAETIANPAVNILDFDKFSSISKKIGVPLIIDNSLVTPYLCKPFEHGANIVVHSATKYIDGHATSVGGVIVDGGNFNWENGNFPCLVDKDPTYHGLSYTEEFKNLAYITKLRVTLLRDLGACLSPFNAFLFNLGLETLHLRMRKHSDNALKLAEFLEKHDKVDWVRYPLLKNDKEYQKANKYLKNGASGMLTFGIKGGIEQAKQFTKNLQLASLVVHIGDARTSVLHPSSTTHRQLSLEEQIASGVTEDLVRVSVGIEDSDDIINDFDQALSKI